MGTTYWVNEQHGDDSNDGLTAETALNTFEEALSRCEDGASVCPHCYGTGRVWVRPARADAVAAVGAFHVMTTDDYTIPCRSCKGTGEKTMNDVDVQAAFKQHGFDVYGVECYPDGKVLIKMSDRDYTRALKRFEFNGPALETAMEQVVNMARTLLAHSGDHYEIGFSGDIAETHAREARMKREERIKDLRRMIPELQAELAALERDPNE